MTSPRGVVLDTSVIIDLDSLNLEELAGQPAVLTAVTIAELAYGLDVGNAAQRAARAERFYRLLNTYPVLPFDTAAAKVFGVLAAMLREAGRNPRPRRTDLQIAATAASNRLPVLTRNPADFAGLDRLVTVLAV